MSTGRFTKVIILILSSVEILLCIASVDSSKLQESEAEGMGVVVLKEIAVGKKKSSFYVSNREPLLPESFIKLPIGSISPRGWLRKQLLLMRDGMTGHLAEISPWCKKENNAWLSPKGDGVNHWEELPYWLKGFTSLGYILKDERIIGEATSWVRGIMASQREDGYFGPRVNWEKNRDLWPNMIALYPIRTYYEATGDKKVLSFMKKYFRWQMTIPLEHFLTIEPIPWQKWRAGDNLDHIYWLYNHTGERWLLELARVNHERTADWVGSIPTWHGVNICQCFREPAQYYQQTKDIRYLRATERVYNTVKDIYGQVPGGMFGADENCRPGYTGPRQGAETCSMVEFMYSFEMLLRITGNPVWADRCEEVAFNSLPAAMTPDLKGLHYLTAPNQIQLDKENKHPMIDNSGNMFAYTPFEDYRCCQHNVAFGWPYYAEHLWLATQDNGLAAVLYAASEVGAKVGSEGTAVKIIEETGYPFDESVEFKIVTRRSAKFPIYLRVPSWCNRPKLYINGKEVKVDGGVSPLSFIKITREWSNNDVVILELPMDISIKIWEKNRNAVSVSRGPLTYSLKIGEKWVRYGGTDKWPAYEVFPTTPWNYALSVNMKSPAASFVFRQVKEKTLLRSENLDFQTFSLEHAPVELHAKGRRVPEWKMEPNGMIGELPESPVKSQEPLEDIVLIPMGCARLRVSAFPMLAEE
jgi:hypothetical protein